MASKRIFEVAAELQAQAQRLIEQARFIRAQSRAAKARSQARRIVEIVLPKNVRRITR